MTWRRNNDSFDFLLSLPSGAGLFVGTQFSGHQGYVLISIANKD
ncbi:hypothetical protein OK016_08590 [Vibrio chagasii]|nr:hypothetical protein [Vibrio chagasii]